MVECATAASPSVAALTGTLAGDAQLEGGCVWLETADGRVEVRWPEGDVASADPLELRAPSGQVVATAGEEVTVTGAPARGAVSICQVGEIWEASEVATP